MSKPERPLVRARTRRQRVRAGDASDAILLGANLVAGALDFVAGVAERGETVAEAAENAIRKGRKRAKKLLDPE